MQLFFVFFEVVRKKLRKTWGNGLEKAMARGLAYQQCRQQITLNVIHFIIFKISVMHNIGRTVNEAHEFENEFEGHEFEEEQEFEGEEEFEGEYEEEYEGEFEGEYEGEYEGEFEEEFEGEFEGEYEDESEAHEMEMATQLLGVRNEQELEQFLGGLISGATKAFKGFAKSGAGKALGGFLKGAAKKALPFAGQALGNMIVPGLGGAIGGKLGGFASNMFELELEGLSNEDKEFEMARAYVRFANNAARKAATNPNYKFQPRRVARAATISSARRFAPGLLKRATPSSRRPSRPGASGTRRRRVGAGVGYGPGYGVANGIPMGIPEGDEPDQPTEASGTWYQQGNQIIINL